MDVLVDLEMHGNVLKKEKNIKKDPKEEIMHKWQSIESEQPEPNKYYLLLIESKKTGKFYATFTQCTLPRLWNSEKERYERSENNLSFTNPYSNCRHILVDLEYGDRRNADSMRNCFQLPKSGGLFADMVVRAFIKIPDLDYPVDIKHECKCPCKK